MEVEVCQCEIVFKNGPDFDISEIEKSVQDAGISEYELVTDAPGETLIRYEEVMTTHQSVIDLINQLHPNFGYIDFETTLIMDEVYYGIDE